MHVFELFYLPDWIKQRINLQLTCKIIEFIVVKSDIFYTAIKVMKLIGSIVAAESKINSSVENFDYSQHSHLFSLLSLLTWSPIPYLIVLRRYLLCVVHNKFKLSFR